MTKPEAETITLHLETKKFDSRECSISISNTLIIALKRNVLKCES